MLNVQIKLPALLPYYYRVREIDRFYLGFLASLWGNEFSSMPKARLQLGNFTYIAAPGCHSDSTLLDNSAPFGFELTAQH
jgi:hypothetical protein